MKRTKSSSSLKSTPSFCPADRKCIIEGCERYKRHGRMCTRHFKLRGATDEIEEGGGGGGDSRDGNSDAKSGAKERATADDAASERDGSAKQADRRGRERAGGSALREAPALDDAAPPRERASASSSISDGSSAEGEGAAAESPSAPSRRSSDPSLRSAAPRRRCIAEGCGKYRRRKKWCARHFDRCKSSPVGGGEAPMRNISLIRSRLLRPSGEGDGSGSISSVDSSAGSAAEEEGASEKKKARRSVKCCVRNCNKTSRSMGMCRKHYLLFGACPPELKRSRAASEDGAGEEGDSRNRGAKGCDASGIGEEGPTDADATEVEETYKAYYFERKNREWRMSHAAADGGGPREERRGGKREGVGEPSFPLEMQRKFAAARRTCIRKSGRDRDRATRRRTAASGDEKRSAEVSFSANGPPSRRGPPEGMSIPASAARRIVQNIKEGGASNIENARDAVFAEARRVLRLDDADESFDRSYMDNGSYNDDDWFQRGSGGEGKGSIFQHMPIDMIDDFVASCTGNYNLGASSSRSTMANMRGDDEVDFGLAHVPMAPPPPSQISYLRQILETKLTECLKMLCAKETSDNVSRRAKQLLDGFDSSAFVSIGIAIEEVMASALIPLAKAHAEHCRRQSQSRHGLKRNEDPFLAWTLPVAEAVSRLSKDALTDNLAFGVISSNPTEPMLESAE